MTMAALNQVLALGQSARAARAQDEVWFYLVVLVIAAVVITVIGLVARKVLSDPIEASEGQAVFDLSDLRKLHRQGQLTDDEYEAAKAATLMDGASFMGKDSAGAPRSVRPAHRPLDDPGVELGPELLDPAPPPQGSDESDNPGHDENSPRD